MSKSSMKIIKSLGAIVCGLMLSFNAFAMAESQCPNSETKAFPSDEIHILTSADLELEEYQKSIQKVEKKTNKPFSWFSWLTQSHSMPSLHFIDFLELFKKS